MSIKKITAAAAAVFAAAVMCVVPAFAAETYETITQGLTLPANGDVNGDGTVNVSDIVMIASQVKGNKIMTGDSAYLADVNNDYNVNVTDVSLAAAQVKGKKTLENTAAGKNTKEARSFLRGEAYHVAVSQTVNGNDAIIDIAVNGNDFRTEMSGMTNDGKMSDLVYVMKGTDYYIIDTVNKTYMVKENVKSNISSQKDMASTMLGENYEYLGWKTIEGEVAEVFKNTSNDDEVYYYAYFAKDGKLNKVLKYTDDGSVTFVNLSAIEAAATVEVPDLTGYKKGDG